MGRSEEREVGGVKAAAQNEAETLRGGGAMTSSMATFILSFQTSKQVEVYIIRDAIDTVAIILYIVYSI